MTNTSDTKRPLKRARVIVVTVIVLLAALGAWKVIDNRREPPAAAFTPTPERLDALRYLTEAKESTKMLSNEFDKPLMLADIAAVQAKAGDLPGAKAMAHAMTKDYEAMILSRIAAVQAATGDFIGAKATIKAVKIDVTDKRYALRALAAAQAKSGDVAGAKATANSIEDNASKDSALREIAAAQAKAGDIAGAIATADAITNVLVEASPLSNIAAAQLKAGDRAGASKTFDRAEAIANTLNGVEKNVALGNIALAEAKAGDITRAKATADAITGYGKEGAMFDIAIIQARAGDIAGARDTAGSLRQNYLKALVLREVAIAQSRTGDKAGASQTFDEAKTMANAETVDLNRDGALLSIARGQAKTGDVAAAKATAAATKDEDVEDTLLDARSKPATVGVIAAAQARVEGFPAAESWVKTVSEPMTRTFCYIALAEARLDPSGTKSADPDEE